MYMYFFRVSLVIIYIGVYYFANLATSQAVSQNDMFVHSEQRLN